MSFDLLWYSELVNQLFQRHTDTHAHTEIPYEPMPADLFRRVTAMVLRERTSHHEQCSIEPEEPAAYLGVCMGVGLLCLGS